MYTFTPRARTRAERLENALMLTIGVVYSGAFWLWLAWSLWRWLA